MDKLIIIDRWAALKLQDSVHQTYGCRHTKPEICADNCMENVCAFVKADKICSRPPRGWAAQYEKLSKDGSSL